MTTEEQEAKARRDLAETHQVLQDSRLILQRINKATERLLRERGTNGNRPKPA